PHVRQHRDTGVDGTDVRRAGRTPRPARAGQRDRRGRIVPPALPGRRPRLSFLHAQPGGAGLCHLPPARPAGQKGEPVMTPRESLLAEAAKRILITDGAFGTEIQSYKLSEAEYAGALGLAKDQKGNNDILALTKPDVPVAIHRA